MGLRYAPRPVVAAPHGQTLGGGAEIVLAADRVVATLETYIGLVEVGVGIVPAGGGCKELLRRLVAPAMRAAPDAPPLPFVQRVFETIGLAKVATSAVEARELGFLEEHDVVVLDADHQLAAAKQEVLDLADAYQPPAREASVYAAGLPVLAALELGRPDPPVGRPGRRARRCGRPPPGPGPVRRRAVARPVGHRAAHPRPGARGVPGPAPEPEDDRSGSRLSDDRQGDPQLKGIEG
jgi:hypothetical protein